METTCIQGGWQPKNGEPRILPIYQSTTFKYSTSEQMGRLFDLEENGYFYTRLQNPTNDAVAAKIADLEGGVAAILTSSGQAANFYAVFNICEAGDHVVAASGISKREILERRVTKNLEELMENRAIHITNDKIPSVSAIEGYDRKANIVYPIIYGGDVSGAVCMIEDENHTLPSETDIKLVQVAAAFLGKQME